MKSLKFLIMTCVFAMIAVAPKLATALEPGWQISFPPLVTPVGKECAMMPLGGPAGTGMVWACKDKPEQPPETPKEAPVKTEPKAPVEIGKINNPLSVSDIPGLMSKILRILFGMLGSVAIIVMILGGFKLAVSSSNPSERTKAKEMLLWATVGMVVSLMAFSIVVMVQNLIKN